MKVQKLLLGSAAVLALSLSSAAMADSNSDGSKRQMRIDRIFAELDTNQDGQITQEEILAGAEARFTKADTDGDGRLSKEEFTANLGRHGERAFTRLDADGDGFVTREELSAALNDGRTMQWLQKADANGDGAITREELEAMKSHRMKQKQDKSDEGTAQ